MSLPGEAPRQAESSARDQNREGTISFTLIVVSPSTGVTSPLTFSQLTAVTTVSQLKAKIRDALPSKPVNEGQRLIHRGRLLGRDEESMLEIFGEEALRSSEPQTLHLVLRPTGPDPLPITSSTPFIPPQRVTTPIPPQVRPRSTPAHPIHGMHAQQPLPGFQHLHQHHTAHQAEHLQSSLGQRLQALQRETLRLQQEMGNIEQRSRALASAHPGFLNGIPPPPQIPQSLQHLLQQAQAQNERAPSEGRHTGPGTGSESPAGSVHLQTGSGRASPNIHRPDHTTTYSREGVGPNGERWQMTVNESSSTFQLPQLPHFRPHDTQVPGANPALDTLQALARTTDRLLANQRTQASQNVQNGPSGSTPNQAPHIATASQASQAQFPARAQPGNFSTGAPAAADSPLPSQIFNPVLSPNSMVRNSNPLLSLANDARGFINTPHRNAEPTVYILSSPQGPQALLLHNSEAYYSLPQLPIRDTINSSSLPPSPRRRRHASPAPGPADYAQVEEQGPAIAPEFQGAAAQPLAHHDNGNNQENRPLEPVGAAHGNPGAGALGARIGPMIWLILRLAGFVWFFTAGNSSWPRFVMITALAVVVFIINTGIFNGIAEAIWGPVRRHVEALIPLAGPEAALVPAVNAAAIPQQPQQVQAIEGPAVDGLRPRRRRGELDEVEVAARLIRQQREMRGDWWLRQVRRIEHAALLFLASLVPGVGERHIAAREAAANAAEAERQREAEAAEAAAAAEISQDQDPEAGSDQPERGGRDIPENPELADEGEGHAAAQPVVAET